MNTQASLTLILMVLSLMTCAAEGGRQYAAGLDMSSPAPQGDIM